LVAGLIQRHTRIEREPVNVLDNNRIYFVGDDLDTAEGPEAFYAETLEWVFKDAACIFLHTCAAEVLHYGLAAAFTLLHKKVVFVESQESKEEKWKEFIDLAAPYAKKIPIAAGKEAIR
jgi:hypothetical protein